MASGSAPFSARPFNLRVESWVNWQSGAVASVHVNIFVDKTAYSPSYHGGNSSTASASVQGVGTGSWGPSSFDFTGAGPWHLTSGDWQVPVNNDGGMLVQGSANFAVLGTASLSYWLVGASLNTPPAPNMEQPSQVTNTSMKVVFHSTGDGGSPVTGWDLQRATDAAFTQNVFWQISSGTTYDTGLAPGTTYYYRARGVNAIGAGAWSNVVSQATLPATPPGLIVASTPSGTQANLTLSPPSGVTGVDKYTYERRATGTTTPVTSAETTTVLVTVPGLVPGNSYDWRASAWFGTYQTPWSEWQTVVQARPNVNPGEYFDGSTPDTGDLEYWWGSDNTGTPNASMSYAIAQGAAGWSAEFPTGGGVMYRVTAGIFSTYAARAQVVVDATAAGLRFGQQPQDPYWSDVTPGGIYVGSLYANLSRSQRVAAEITWLTAAGAVVSRTLGAQVEAPGGSWVRFVAGGTAPATAEFAVVRLIDVTGTGWSTWKGGDAVLLDGAMVSLGQEFPYFDGSTLPDGTYTYAWTDPELPHASTSERRAVAQAGSRTFGSDQLSARAILDPNCIPPTPPRPPTIPSDCIVEAGIWRRYYADIPAVQISDWLDVVPTFELITQSLNVSQVRIRIYPNPSGGAASSVDPNSWISEQIVSYVPANTTLTIDGVHQRVWAEVAGGEAISADHLLYGSNGTPATWPVLSCGIAYSLSVDLPVEIMQGDSRLLTHLTTRY